MLHNVIVFLTITYFDDHHASLAFTGGRLIQENLSFSTQPFFKSLLIVIGASVLFTDRVDNAEQRLIFYHHL